jgi:hypothetical protein
MIKIWAFSLVLFLTSISSRGQTVVLGDSLKVSFIDPDKAISDSNRLYTGVVLENIAKRPIEVYKELIEGYLNDRFCNAHLSVEKQMDGKFVPQPLALYKSSPEEEAIRHFDPPKTLLSPGDRDTLKLFMGHLGLIFTSGKYRVKFSLRSETILNRSEYQFDPTGASVPPLDKIKYIASDWKYFRVITRLY